MILVTDYCATGSIQTNLKILGMESYRINERSPNPFWYKEQMDKFHGLVLSGGQDVHPKYYGQENRYSHIFGGDSRDEYELEILKDFVEAGKKVLGICRGHQLLNIFFGGSLHQDIYRAGYSHQGVHNVVLSNFGSILFKTDAINTNSLHHQAVDIVAEDFDVIAEHWADGAIEGIYSERYKSLGVQWHPEMMEGTEEVFEWLSN